MEMNQALDLLANAGIVFEVVYAGENERCPICFSEENPRAA